MRCIVLAAGASSRMGQPKALLEIDGKPLIQHLVERLEAQGLEPVIVTNAEISIDVLLALPERTVVINPNPEAGRTGSLQCGVKLSSTPREASGHSDFSWCLWIVLDFQMQHCN